MFALFLLLFSGSLYILVTYSLLTICMANIHSKSMIYIFILLMVYFDVLRILFIFYIQMDQYFPSACSLIFYYKQLTQCPVHSLSSINICGMNIFRCGYSFPHLLYLQNLPNYVCLSM